MKPWHAGVVVLALALGAGWFQSCAAVRAERELHELAYQSYRADSARWATANALMLDSLVVLRRDSSVLAGRLAVARGRAQGAAARLEAALAQLPDTGAPADLQAVLLAGAACDAAYSNCEARVALEKLRADAATAGRLSADSAAFEGHAWALAEIRRSRTWRPWSLRPPGLLWSAALVLLGRLVAQ